jgi:hypothetical protein
LLYIQLKVVWAGEDLRKDRCEVIDPDQEKGGLKRFFKHGKKLYSKSYNNYGSFRLGLVWATKACTANLDELERGTGKQQNGGCL